MSDYWKDSEDNPFKRMSWTRGGGGLNNSLTAESNQRRADAMTGVDALPRFATMGVAQAALPAQSLAVVGDNVIRTSGPGSPTARTAPAGNGGSGPGVAVATNVPANQPKSKGSKLSLEPKLNPNATALLAGGREIVLDTGWSDGQEFEDRWGEWGGALGGLGTMAADLWQSHLVERERLIKENPLQGQGALFEAWEWLEGQALVNATARLGTDGTVWKTGGGF